MPDRLRPPAPEPRAVGRLMPRARWPVARPITVTVLGSGSAGNATLVAHGDRPVLLDAGLSCREIERRLEGLGVRASELAGVVLTHAHGDHVRAVRRLASRHGVPVHATRTTWHACGLDGGTVRWSELRAGGEHAIAGLRWRPFVVPHDVRETLAFRIETPLGAIGVATDVGRITTDLVRAFADCTLVVIEANHARELLRVSPYVASVRRRIGGDEGHLSNEALAEFVERHLGATVRCLVLAHISRVNNLPELAAMACREALERRGRPDVSVVIAHQDRCSDTVDLAALAVPGWRPAPSRAHQLGLPFAAVEVAATTS